MKTIIENGAANKDIQNCFVTEHGVEIIFDSNDLADKFALSLNNGVSKVATPKGVKGFPFFIFSVPWPSYPSTILFG